MQNYLTDVFSGATEGFISVWTKANRKTRWYSIADLAMAADDMRREAANDDVYFGWHLQGAPASGSGRGTSSTVVASGGIMFDADLKAENGAHANDALPESLEEVIDFLDEIGFPRPTAIRNSGNGLYLDYLLKRVIVFSTDEERDHFALLSSRFHKGLIAAGKRARGWEFDNTSDLARITRFPGTKNHKTNPPKDVTLLEEYTDKRFSIEELNAAVLALESKHPTTSRSSNTKPAAKHKNNPERQNDDDEQILSTPSFDSVESGCAWAKQIVSNADNLTEPNWYAAASIVGRCQDGQALFHEISKSDARYNVDETQKKLTHALESARPRTCENIHTSLGHTDCAGCTFFGKLKSPIELGYLDSNVTKLMREHVYDVATCRYINLSTLTALDEGSFTSKYRHLTKKAAPHHVLVSHKFTRKVDRTDYLAGVSNLFIETDSATILNTWKNGGPTPTDGDCSTILDHLSYLLPNKEEHEHVLNCLASIAQQPDKKIRHLLLLIGPQGTGKSFLGKLLERMLGKTNVRTIESDQLTSAWTAELANCQILVTEELMTAGRMETYDKLKTVISEETVTVNQKHVRQYSARTPRLLLAFSNHPNPTFIKEGDRRFHVSRSATQKHSGEYYTHLFQDGLNEAAAFLGYLMKRNITSFNPSAPPPMTGAKSDIIESSLPLVQQELATAFEDGDLPINGDTFSVGDALFVLSQRIRNRVTTSREITNALKEMGAVRLPQKRVGETRVRLWKFQDGIRKG